VKDAAAKAVEKLQELLDLATDVNSYEDEETWLAALRVLSGAVTTALNTQLRVDEGAMQAQRDDKLIEIIRLIQEEEKTRPMRLVN